MNLNIIGQSVQGYLHKIHKPEELPCQDAFLIKEIEKDIVYAVAVADGHGSPLCRYSDEGAEISAGVFCDKMAELYFAYKDDIAKLWAFLHRDGSLQLSQEIVLEWRARIRKKHVDEGRRCTEIPVDKSIDEWEKWKDVYYLYGTTMVGMLIAPEFHFAIQIGDGDITKIENGKAFTVIEGDKILGVETHSLCEKYPWRDAYSILMHTNEKSNFAYVLSSDGFKNSHKTEKDYFKSCEEYVSTLRKANPKEFRKAIGAWLSETSEFGCGDDITVVIIDSFDQILENNVMVSDSPEEIFVQESPSTNSESISNTENLISNQEFLSENQNTDNSPSVCDVTKPSDDTLTGTIVESSSVCNVTKPSDDILTGTIVEPCLYRTQIGNILHKDENSNQSINERIIENEEQEKAPVCFDEKQDDKKIETKPYNPDDCICETDNGIVENHIEGNNDSNVQEKIENNNEI